MSNNWIWAGGFLVLAIGSIGFGAKAGVESGREALRVEALEAKHGSAEHEETHAPVARAGARDQDSEVKKPAEARVAKAPARLELVKNAGRAGTVQPKVNIPRVEVKRPAPPTRPATRLSTPASELDVAFATGRIDRLPGRYRPIPAFAAVRAPSAPTPKEEVEAKPEAPKAPKVEAPEPTPDAAADSAAPRDEVEAPEAAPSAEAPAAKASEAVETTIEAPPSPDAEKSTENPTPAAEAAGASDVETSAVDGMEEWLDETDEDRQPYQAYLVMADPLEIVHARL